MVLTLSEYHSLWPFPWNSAFMIRTSFLSYCPSHACLLIFWIIYLSLYLYTNSCMHPAYWLSVVYPPHPHRRSWPASLIRRHTTYILICGILHSSVYNYGRVCCNCTGGRGVKSFISRHSWLWSIPVGIQRSCTKIAVHTLIHTHTYTVSAHIHHFNMRNTPT